MVNPFLGVILHAIGGVAAASFYIPYSKVKKWAWEVYWIVGGFVSWIIAPWVLALVFVPETFQALASAPASALFWTFLFGLLWGIGGLTFGLTMRFLGIALGYALALGLTAVFGTLVPPIFAGELADIAASRGGQLVLLGIAVAVLGIACSGYAGRQKEKQLTPEEKTTAIEEFDFRKGLIVALVAGLLSACMAFALAAAAPIRDAAADAGAASYWGNMPVLPVIFLGGFLTNLLWCAFLILKNNSADHFFANEIDGQPIPRLKNYGFCTLAGFTWYLQFFFYGIAATMMGQYEFSSWMLHMASIILFSSLWGVFLKEWRGTHSTTKAWLAAGVALLILSIVIIGYGNALDDTPDGTARAATLAVLIP